MPAPRPLADPDSRGFWENADAGRFALQQCADCAQYMFPPIEACRFCGGKLAYQPLSGEGEIYSYIVQHHGVTPGFDDKLPYVIAVISPAEAPQLRVPTRIVGVEPGEVRCGQHVRAQFETPEGAEHAVVLFTPTD
jgi:uncharacterized protein